MKKRQFMFGAGMLAALGIVAKLVGVFYRLPLTSILGTEGMGLYQMIFPVYSLVIAFIAGGIPAAVARCVSELNALGRGKESERALKIAAVVPVALGVVAALLLAIFRRRIAALQGNEEAAAAYVAISPAIVVYGVIASVRGYFQGLNNLLPTGISQLIEQVLKAAIGLALAAALRNFGAAYAAFGALTGVSLSEVAAAVYLCVRFLKRDKVKMRAVASLAFEAGEDAAYIPYGRGAIFRKIFSVAIPATLGSLVLPLSTAVDSFLVVNLLSKSVSVSEATSLYGIFAGPVNSLVNLPSVLTAALAAALLPEIAALTSKGLDVGEAFSRKMIAMSILVVPIFAVFFLAPRPVLRLLYFNGLSDEELSTAALLLRIESVNVPLLGVIQLVSSFGHGTGKALAPAACLAVGAVMKVASVVVLLPVVGIVGAAVSSAVCYASTCALDVICLRRREGRLSGGKRAWKVLLCAVVFFACMALYVPLSAFMGEIAAFFASLTTAICAYLLAIVKTKCILLNEILS